MFVPLLVVGCQDGNLVSSALHGGSRDAHVCSEASPWSEHGKHAGSECWFVPMQGLPRSSLQLASVACELIAAKHEEVQC